MFDAKPLASNKIILDGLSFDTQGSDQQPLCPTILRSAHQQFKAMLSHHSTVLVVRLESRVNHFSSCNASMLRVLKGFIRQLKQRYKLKRVGYQWVREIERSAKQHYHLVIAIDGNKVNYPAKIHRLWEMCHERAALPKPFTPKNSYVNVSRGDLRAYRDVIYRMSYLAKCRGKDFSRTWLHNFACSRVSMGDRLGEMFAVNNNGRTA